MKARDFIRLARPAHWVKNAFVFLPAFFAGRFDDPRAVAASAWAAAALALASSFVYGINDVVDREADRRHPSKSSRPVASGAIHPAAAAAFSAGLLAAGLAIALFRAGPATAVVVVAYAALNVAYSAALKHVPVLDVVVVALGFILRVLAGSSATGIYLSPWLVLMTFLGSLMLALGKRKDDIDVLESTGGLSRKAVEQYSKEFLSSAILMSSSILVMAYVLYCVTPEITARFGTENVYMTAVFVVVGILRYLQQTLAKGRKADPMTLLFSDAFLLSCVLAYIATMACLLYFL